MYICYTETPKTGECRLSPVNVDIRRALMVNVEHGDLYFLLYNSVAIKRYKNNGGVTFSPLLLKGTTKNLKYAVHSCMQHCGCTKC